MEQRWLSIHGICTVLGMTPRQIERLVKERCLVKISGNHTKDSARYLDPTPEYTERLKLGQVLHSKMAMIPVDLDMKALLTLREVAAILGVSWGYTNKLILIKKSIPTTKIGGVHFCKVDDVRDLLWRRGGRRFTKQLSPFLIMELVEWFQNQTKELEGLVPDDEAQKLDRRIQKKLAVLMKNKSPHREDAMRDYLAKVALAKTVAQTISSSSCECTSQSVQMRPSLTGELERSSAGELS